MDYEQKYKEANNKVAARFGTNVAKEIFADLYESEDEKIKRGIIKFLKENKDFPEDWIAWLEKKPAWNEEDEGELYLTISLLNEFKKEAYTNDCENCINWLKSLKPQSRWKPTYEQMQSLYLAIITYIKKNDKLTYDGLNSLYDDLKKL